MINTLTSMRFFFALMVFMSHIASENSRFFAEGFVGVNFFFILSGFIIAYSYSGRLSERKTSVKNFYIARFARIYPMHLLTLIVSVLFITNGSIQILWDNIKTFLLNLFLLQGFIPNKDIYFSFNAVSWSISDEMFFYALFPILALIFAKIRSGYKIFSIGLMAVIIIVLNIKLPNAYYKHAILYINPFIRSFDFILGIYLYELWIYFKKYNIKERYFNYLEIGSIALFGLSVFLSEYVPVNFRYSVYYWPSISLLLFTFAYQRGFISKLISIKPLLRLGEASYCFYMIHVLVIQIIPDALKIPKDNPFYYTGSVLLICICLSYLLHKFFELPVNKFLKNNLTTSKK